MKMEDLKKKNGKWFSPENQKFFGDLSYYLEKGEKSGKYFLVRKTTMWSDMFDRPRKEVYRINTVDDDGTIGLLVKEIFEDYFDVDDYLSQN